MARGVATELLRELRLLDGHCHRVLARTVDDDEFERCCTEADRLAAPGTAWDTAAGFAIRRWCAPLLGLPPLAAPAEYLRTRAALGVAEVSRRLLRAARLSHLVVDTGLAGPHLGDLDELAAAAGAPVSEVVRLESVAEELAGDGVTAHGFAAAYAERLTVAARRAVACKSVLAYRHGLDVEAGRPEAAEVRAAVSEWLARASPRRRLDHPVLLRFVLWAAVDVGLPIQVHTGFGDRDLRLDRADPSLLQPLLAAMEPAGVPVVLLHAYPYHRQAGWLAAVYPHVHVDAGLTVGQIGRRAGAVLAELLELAPLAKVLFSTDGYRLPELYLVGAAQFRESFGRLLDGWVEEAALSAADAERAVRLVACENARRLYALDAGGTAGAGPS